MYKVFPLYDWYFSKNCGEVYGTIQVKKIIGAHKIKAKNNRILNLMTSA